MNCDLIIFGGTGDLAKRSLLPALYDMRRRGDLGAGSRIISASRREMSDADYRRIMAPEHSSGDWQAFAQCLHHRSMDIAAGHGFSALHKSLQDAGDRKRLLYLSTLPEHFVSAVQGAHEAGLVTKGTTVIVEKPVGTDLPSARALNNKLSEIFDEQHILRIDHYLGKTRVRALAEQDFATSGKSAHAVQITLAEAQDIGTRGEFYDRTGALRDMLQNHLLQLLCLVAALPGSDDLNAAKVEMLEGLLPQGKPVWGQFEGYLEVPGVEIDSHTETFVAMEVRLNIDPWRDRPFLLRTGKCLAQKQSQVVVGNEVLDLSLRGENAYAALLRDALRGDRSKFVSREEVEAAWCFIDRLRAERSAEPPESYAKGSWGPSGADALAKDAGAEWHNS